MRQVKYHIVTAKNRDVGKKFQITELPASQAEAWAFRAFQALARTGVDIQENISGAGMAGLAIIGFKALAAIPYFDAQELMAEMMSCVKICRSPELPDQGFSLMEEDIEEVATRIELRKKVFELHTGFSFADFEQNMKSKSAGTTDQNTSPTQTSTETLAS